MKIILYLVLFVMSLLTFIGLNVSFSRFMFANGSDGLMELISSNMCYRIIFFTFFTILVVTFTKWKNKFYYYSIISTIFIFWILSGRMVALFPDGRLISGWFYFETKRIDICNNNADCEKIFYYETKYSKEKFFVFKIENKEIEEKVFVGPFILKEASSFFSKTFVNSDDIR